MKASLVFALMFFSLPVSAYIGPGLGAGAIAATVGVIGAIMLAVLGLLYYPFKRLLKKRKANKARSSE